jgi:fumarate hydratase class II
LHFVSGLGRPSGGFFMPLRGTNHQNNFSIWPILSFKQVSFVAMTHFSSKEKVMTTHRSEKDSMGAIDVPADKLWGAQTQRSLEHFRISTEKMPGELIYALALTKRAAAKVNQDLGLLTAEKAGAIVAAADEVLAGKHAQEFPLAIWQTGSGTQSNMNMNEVLANRASELLGGERGMARKIHPNDDVNKARAQMTCSPPPCTSRR